MACICVCAQTPTRAQSLQDPMRPPSASTAARTPGAAAASSGLQAVITSPGRKLAVIDGAIVPLGASVNRSTTLSGVSDSLAVLDKNGVRDVLLMHPNIEKKPSRKERP